MAPFANRSDDHAQREGLIVGGDLGHAQQVDPTLGVARKMLHDHGHRLAQIHLSELDVDAHHRPLSMVSVWAIREIVRLIPECPVILESLVPLEAIDEELEMAARCFEAADTGRSYAGAINLAGTAL